MPENRLRIMTLNLWNLNHWEERREELVSGIHDLRPDVIGFQEVTRTDDLCQATWIGEQVGMEASFRGFPRPDGSMFGNATLSRFPIVDTADLPLPDPDRSAERRLCLGCTLETPRGPIRFYNTHLNYLFDDGRTREAQVVALSAFVSETALPACPPVLVGDFNAVPDASEIRYLKGLTSLQGKSFHLFDSFQVAHPDVPGYTWSNRNPYAAANRVPDQRIDYIFVGVRNDDGTGQVLDSQVVFDDDRRGRWASDHFGVMTDIVFA